jgi:hypothetical protein
MHRFKGQQEQDWWKVNMVAVDARGRKVTVGDSIRVLHIRDSVLDRLDPDGRAKVMSMKGTVLQVYEVDDWGGAWVRQEWVMGSGRTISHSLMLTSAEMELADRP